MTRLYRSFLIAPANRPDMVRKFARFAPDVAVIDLEDGTPEAEKERARDLAVASARELAGLGCSSQLFVRTNAIGSTWIEGDLAAVVGAPIAGICLPKVGTVEDVVWVERRLAELEREAGCPPLETILGLESVPGIHNAVDITLHATRACALYFGGEDYMTDAWGRRTDEGSEILYARSRAAIAARLGGIAAFDTATLEIRDDERFRRTAAEGRNLGYQGRICVHPRQVVLSHEVFAPSPEEVDRAVRLLRAYEASVEEGNGVCEFEGEMLDGPLVKRAEQIVALALQHEATSA